MPTHTALIFTVAAGLGVAFLFGLAAARMRLPPIVGYLLAGVAVGQFATGKLVDVSVIAQASELGVILLMFGVGMHFSLSDLGAVRRVVVPGALLQILVTGSVGTAMRSRLEPLRGAVRSSSASRSPSPARSCC